MANYCRAGIKSLRGTPSMSCNSSNLFNDFVYSCHDVFKPKFWTSTNHVFDSSNQVTSSTNQIMNSSNQSWNNPTKPWTPPTKSQTPSTKSRSPPTILSFFNQGFKYCTRLKHFCRKCTPYSTFACILYTVLYVYCMYVHVCSDG